MKKFSIVVATSLNWGIGKSGSIPWNISKDMQYFKSLTSTNSQGFVNVVIMGRKTWESIPKSYRPLKKRINIVLSRSVTARDDLNLPDDVFIASSLNEALELVNDKNKISNAGDIYVIGGGEVYNESLKSPYCKKIYLTEILQEFPDTDTFFPPILATDYSLVKRSAVQIEGCFKFRYSEFDKIEDEFQSDLTGNIDEMQYINTIKDILENGNIRGDRTGTGTISKFGVQMRFNLRNGILPLLTTKKVFWRGVAEELLWFIKGSTNAKLLQNIGIHVWDGNSSKEYLSKIGLADREEGDLGPIYGFQWRHFGAKYSDMHADYTGQGIDQLNECINKLKTNPEDRRIIMTAWNPCDISLMALPPCHMFCQFYVANGELSCQMYQRSADMGLGVPFNIASYSLLTILIAQVCGLKPGEFVHSIGDAHIYLNHIDALKEQITRIPRSFPTIKINPAVTSIDDFTFNDFTVDGYNPYGTIKMTMAV